MCQKGVNVVAVGVLVDEVASVVVDAFKVVVTELKAKIKPDYKNLFWLF